MMTVKAIDTVYNGYEFRSRLEARWAVYFDAVGLEWDYEIQGFEFSDGTKYLPDFWLPQVKLFGEVKPHDLDDDDTHKVTALVETTGFGCLLLIGTPSPKPYCTVESDGHNWWVGISMFKDYPNYERRFYGNADPDEFNEDDFAKDGFFKDAFDACLKARMARFEFGQTPKGSVF